MSLILQSSGGGSVTIQEPSTASNLTATLPAATGTVMVSGNMPAFSATRTATQSITANTWTKIQYNVEQYDTANCYDPTTNFRFTPNVAGYYQVTVNNEASSAQNYNYSSIYKNGLAVYRASTGTGAGTGVIATALVYLNGSTDYVEGYCFYQTSQNLAGNEGTYFQAVLVRTA